MVSWLGPPAKPLVFLILVTEQIDPAILPISFGVEDHKALASNEVFDRRFPVPQTSPTREEMRVSLNSCLRSNHPRKVVVYLSARSAIARWNRRYFAFGCVGCFPSPHILNGSGEQSPEYGQIIRGFQIHGRLSRTPENCSFWIFFSNLWIFPLGLPILIFRVGPFGMGILSSSKQRKPPAPVQCSVPLFAWATGDHQSRSEKKCFFCHFLVECLRGRLTPPLDCGMPFLAKFFFRISGESLGPTWIVGPWKPLGKAITIPCWPRRSVLSGKFLDSEIPMGGCQGGGTVPPIPKVTGENLGIPSGVSAKPHEVVDNPRYYSKLFFPCLECHHCPLQRNRSGKIHPASCSRV